MSLSAEMERAIAWYAEDCGCPLETSHTVGRTATQK